MTEPIPMLLWCPECLARHVDVGRFATHPPGFKDNEE